MKTRKTGGLPAKLEAVRRRFDRWRKTHRPRSRIPDTLGDGAVRTAGTHGRHRTARVLRLDYYRLKERLDQRAAAEAESAEGSTAGRFWSWPVLSRSGLAHAPSNGRTGLGGRCGFRSRASRRPIWRR